MRLHHLAGNRSAALRQYERCVAFLRQELDVDPSAQTVALYEQIRSDRLPSGASLESTGTTLEKFQPTLPQAVRQLKNLQTVFAKAHYQLQEIIQVLEVALTGRG